MSEPTAEGLTEAEQESLARELFAAEQCDRRQRQALDYNWRERLNDSDQREYRTMAAELAPFIERILADRLAAVQAERDHWQEMHRAAFGAGIFQQDRAESAEAERDAALAALDRVKAAIWALGESIHGEEGVEHNEGCAGEPDCLACILEDLRAALRAAVEGGRS